jgi:hypothetical protein
MNKLVGLAMFWGAAALVGWYFLRRVEVHATVTADTLDATFTQGGTTYKAIQP